MLASNVRATMPKKFYRSAKARLKDRLTSEMLQCQIEVTTSPCASIPDVCTRIEDGLCIAALFRCLARHLFNHPELNADLGVVERAFALENKWRAQRYGTKASFVERGSKAARTMSETVDELLDRLHTDAEALDCVRETLHARTILARGSSAHRRSVSIRRRGSPGAVAPRRSRTSSTFCSRQPFNSMTMRRRSEHLT
jgi:carboxylate-amine ligase